MAEKTGHHHAGKRLPYVKPEVRRIILRPEEAVLAACKTSKISGPGGGRCNIAGPCSSMQS